MYYYAYIDPASGVCLAIEEYEEQFSNPYYILLDSKDTSLIVRKKYVGGEWVDTTADEAQREQAKYIGIDGEWLDERIYGIDEAIANHTHDDLLPRTDFEPFVDIVFAIAGDMDGKASVDHTHSEYALASDLDLLEDVVDTKADSSHTHYEYAEVSHNHTEYANVDHVHDEYATTTHAHSDYATVTALDTLSAEVDEKADSAHTHSEYATTSHTHSEYADATHTHDYASTTHTHSNYANVDHTHDEYASSTHTHTASEVGAAASGHNHDADYADINHAHDNYAVNDHDHDLDYAAIDHVHDDYATVTALSEVSATVSNKANSSHTHDDRYYTETEIDTKLSGKSDSTHNHAGVYDVNGAAAEALDTAKDYTDSKIDALVGEGASTTLDTIGEISSAIEDNQDAIDLLNSAIANKANSADLTSHINNTVNHITNTERSNWNIAKNHADSVHAPSNAEPNQNAFSNIVVGNSTIAADTKTDTLTLVAGNNVTLTPNVEGDSVTIAATNTVYTHPTSAGNKHIPAGGSSGQILRWSADGTAVWGADNNTTYSNATQSASGLMSGADKTKLDGIAEGANAYTLPSAGTSLGGVKSGGDVTISSGVITVNDDSHNHVISNVDGLQSALDGKAASNHSHDSVYYTETEVDTLLSGKASTSHNHNSSYDALGTAETKANEVQANLDVVNEDLTEHIDNTDIHFTVDERTKLSGIATNANNYTHPNSGVTSGTYKSVTVNAQGHITKGTNPTTLAGYGITDAESKGAANNALASAKKYADELIADEVANRDSAIATAKSSAISTAASDATTKANNALASAKTYADSVTANVKNDLLNGAGTAYDTLKELGDLIDDNTDAISALETVAAGKANTSHTHTIANVTNLQSALDGKAATSHGTHVSYSTTAPVMDGTASVGTASTVARSDHKHPIDTSRAAQVDLDALETAVAGKANSSHTHAIANVTNLQTSLDSKQSTITGGATTITSSNLTTNRALISNGSGKVAVSDVTSTELGYLDGVTSNIQTQLDGKAVSGHTHSAATASANGLMSASDKAKLDGIASGANAYTLPTASSSTLGGVKTTSTVTSNSGYTACPIISGVPYYKDTNTTYSLSSFGVTATASELNALDGITATVTELNYVDGVTSNIQTQLNNKASSTHNHGLLHTDFTKQIDNTTTDSGWSMINNSYTGFILKSLRTQANAPTWAIGNYSAGVAFGGADTKGVITHAYNSPQVRFAGGNGTAPVWYFTLNATSGKTYTLPSSGGTIALTNSNITGNAATASAVAWSGVTNKPSYYDAKAIKSITRSGTTFTYTCMDGTTGTFTQQDNNTTYSTATASANGLMSASDKSKLDGMVLATVSEVETYLGI